MNVLMLLEGSFPPDPRVRKQAKTLNKSGHNVRLLCHYSEVEKNQDRNIEINTFKPAKIFPNYRSYIDIPYMLLTFRFPELSREIKKQIEWTDIIHVHDMRLAKTALEFQKDSYILIDMHENYKEAIRQFRQNDSLKNIFSSPKNMVKRIFQSNRRYAKVQKEIIQNSDGVLATVKEAKNVYAKDLDSPDKVHIVSNVVDLEWFDNKINEFSIPDLDGFVLTYVGGITGPHRGLETLIKAMPDIKNEISSAQLSIVGDGAARSSLEQLALEIGANDYINFKGWANYQKIPVEMRSADVGVVPHKSTPHTRTTIPHKLTQYMAAGLPVIVTDSGPIASIVRETNTGMVVPPSNPNKMAEAAIEIAKQKVSLKNPRELVEERYNWETEEENLLQQYNKFNENVY